MNDVALAIDLGGTNLRVATILPDGQIIHLARSRHTGMSPVALMALLERLGGECISAMGGEHNKLVAIAAGVPANFSSDGLLTHVTNLPDLEGMSLRADLEAKFGVPAFLENDATAAAIGENWLGAARDVRDSITVTLGTGVGGGIIIDNEPLRGLDGTAGRIGHICVEPDGHPCGCGSRGCVEQYASATALVRMAGEQDINAWTAADLYDAAMAGNTRAEAVFYNMGRYLGIMLAGLVNTLNPEMIVVGGGVAAGWDAFIGHVNHEVSARAYAEPAERVQVVRTELGEKAGILGAARTAFLNT